MIEGSDIDRLKEFLPELTETEEEKFRQYFDVLCHFNRKINLVSRASIKNSGGKHFSDSYKGLKIFEEFMTPGATMYDFGSGNGFPGIIGAVMYPEVKHILIERDKRKGEFLKFLAQELLLNNVGVHIGAAKDIKENSVQIAMSRAMAPLPKMLLEMRKLSVVGGRIFLFKGDTWTTEFGNCPPQLFDLWDVKLKGHYNIPSLDMERFIIECTRKPEV
ncbi:MAG: 16S rRNA (guanine(527)-N(7))-methyltransferase RsmG [Bdellovibrionales bacterium]|nr:16S rRNA (guanine(527)-N(7))-methyltransferase RsmG [Bdellovibrionales bacterium]NQZ18995.1 16S rRNA (guanine(527)-N(7))-methyltransferase RsmG [Bdellovibrionales bacterium]